MTTIKRQHEAAIFGIKTFQNGNVPQNTPQNPPQAVQPSRSQDAVNQDAQLRSMIESTGQLDIDERGNWDFHGNSSGRIFLKRLREQFGGLLATEKGIPFLPRPRHQPLGMLDSPRSSSDSPLESGLPNVADLPSRETARALANDSLNSACALLRFVHQPSFYNMLDRIYDIPAEAYGDAENRFLPLLYVVLAVGCMFHANSPDIDEANANYRLDIDQGLKYFRAGRQMIDITDCRDIVSLQALLFMILFLQSSANLSTCYSYIGIALRSALRMGMHRNIPGNFTLIEREVRRRVFWIIRKMDTYVSALLGFPQMLSSDDIDQELPLEVADECITKEVILPMPAGQVSMIAASNAHTRLMAILAKVIKYIYPIKGLEQSIQGEKSSYIIRHSRIREIERDLAEWLDKLPMSLRPGGDATPDVMRVRQLLRLAYAHVQMMLYRPFLHYVSRRSSANKVMDDRSYACAAACVSVSRNIVHITSEMKKRGLLIGAYWFTMYTTFFAILSLVFFVLENPDKDGSKEILADANAGKDALVGLARKSLAADRCSATLQVLFEQLPRSLTEVGNTPSTGLKKRAAPSHIPQAQVFRRSTDLSQPDPDVIRKFQRSTTFPLAQQQQQQSATVPVTPLSLDTSRFTPSNLSDNSFRSNFQELMSPSSTGTPESGIAGNTQGQQYGIQQGAGSNYGIGIPDLSVMFPSGDPFAYPNQPMMEFENNINNLNIKQENPGATPGDPTDISNDNNVYPDTGMGMFMGNGTTGQGQKLFDDIEGQLFGPLPPYLMQGQQTGSGFDTIPGQPPTSVMNGIDNVENNFGLGTGTSDAVNWGESSAAATAASGAGVGLGMFAMDGDDWGSLLGDSTYKSYHGELQS
ncbi:fungal-specific transcription factor domain-containing protein [Xylogone sp. PMI_703]|nr:fungal-specific transcription factor domain-containing protein [Xylogone sp. PMI_703]